MREPIRMQSIRHVPGVPPTDTKQAERYAREKRQLEPSENELPSTQDKNPVSPGTTRSTAQR